jgi:hypothetical protein
MICGRCYQEVDELFDAPCDERPEKLIGSPIGQYHCPECGIMLIAGIEHFKMCERCIESLTSD